MEILNIKDLSFKYPESENNALKNISFSAEKGEFVLICGKSGCGKSTLLRMIKPSLSPKGEKNGDVLFMGKAGTSLSQREETSAIGFVMQNPYAQTVTDKVYHELAFTLESLGESQQSMKRKISETASFFGLSDIFRENTANLSGGQLQLINLASVCVTKPRLLLLDEPTSQLDPISAEAFFTMLKKLNEELGTTVIVAEHRLDELLPLADKLIIMDSGKIMLSGAPKEVCKKVKALENETVMLSMPSAVRIYSALSCGGECPVTVKEAQKYLSDNFKASDELIEEKEVRGETALEAKNIFFRYERNSSDVLRGFSFKAEKSSVTSILGANGIGKTTVLKVLSGQKKAYRGEVLISGKKIGKMKQTELYRENIALLPQDPQLIFIKNDILTDYMYTAERLSYSDSERDSFINETAESLGISHLLNRHPYDLSGGEIQLCALGKLLILRPSILLLDEPSKGIDSYSKKRLGEILCSQAKQGKTIIIVTHDIEFAAKFSDKCCMLFDGEVVSCDTSRSFFSENSFYTTAASRISRHMFKNTVLCEDIIEMCGKQL